MKDILIIVVLVGLVIGKGILEKNRKYTEMDFPLRRIDESNNTYYFQVPINFWERKKMEEARKRFGPLSRFSTS